MAEPTKDSKLLHVQAQFDEMCRQECIGWQAQRQFLRQLGTGGQGIVYLSERRGSAEFKLPLALKVFSAERYSGFDAYDREMRRMTRVAAQVARIQQDQVVMVLNVINHSGLYLLEMEWIDGYDLQRLLRRGALSYIRDNVTERRWQNINNTVVTPGAEDSRLKPGTAVSVIRECLSGLAAMHRNNIVHCDIKPANIMIKRTGNVKLIDIGSAFAAGDLPDGQPCTPEYAAPEVLRGERATRQSDLASVGYVLIKTLSGTNPFAGLKYAQLLQAKETLLDRVTSLLPVEEFAYTEPLVRFLRRLIHPDPTQRFATAEEAEVSDEGAAGFLRELIKSDVPDHYTKDLRDLILEIDPPSELSDDFAPSSDIPPATTQLRVTAEMPVDETGSFSM